MIALTLAIALQAVGPAWTIDRQVSAVDGRRSFIAGVESEGTVRNIRGAEQKAMFSVSCVDRRRSVGLVWPGFLGSGEVQVTWRIGDSAPRTDRFGAASGTNAVLNGRAAERIIAAAHSGEMAQLRVQGFQNVQEASFDLSAGAEALAELDQTCPR